MNKYKLQALVRRTVIDTISLDVEAKSPDEALSKATRVLESFPSEHSVEGCSYAYIENRQNQDSEVLEIESRETPAND